MRPSKKILLRLRWSPALALLCLGCSTFDLNHPTGAYTTNRYQFSKDLPNPCDPKIPYIDLPGFGYTPTSWRITNPDGSTYCPPVVAPDNLTPVAAPEEISAPPAVSAAPRKNKVSQVQFVERLPPVDH